MALAAGSAPALPAAESAGTGTIEGRVLNTRNGEYIERARVTVDGTALETFTESGGQFRLGQVPAGTAKVRVFFTGLEPRVETVTVPAGAVVQRDFELSADRDAAAALKEDRVVKLSRFVVDANRQMDGAAIALNEQRFAPNIKTVISADEFGTAAEGDIGEVLKFVPGVTMEYAGDEARRVSIDGTPSEYTPVTMSGFNLANDNQSSTTRGVSLDQVSLNNISRVEVMQSPTPESPGAALAGSVNLVLRSAFERSKPSFTINTYVTMRDSRKDLGKTPGSRMGPTRKVLPGFEFSYIKPVNRRFGFSISGGGATVYSMRDHVDNTWRGAGFATNGNAFPDTVPGRPYLSDYQVRDGDIFRTKSSAALTLDYKFNPNDRVSFTLQRNSFGTDWDNHTLLYLTNRVVPGGFSPTATQGAVGAGEIRVTTESRSRDTVTYMPTLLYRHDGPIWKAQAGAAYSSSIGGYHDTDRGYFTMTQARRTGVTISFADINYLRPGRITVTDANGAPIDPHDIRNYAAGTGTSTPIKSYDVQRSAQGHLARDFDWHGMPLTLKAGFDVNSSIRDLRGANPGGATFVGVDGRASTTPVGSDDSAVPFYAAGIADRGAPFGFPTIPSLSNELFFQHFKAHPNQFTTSENTAHVNLVTQSKRADEIVSAAYFRGDIQLLQRRLKLVGGVRAEQTNVTAEGPLNDPTLNYQRDAAGQVRLGTNGRPLLITNDALAITKLTRVERGSHADKEYLRWFPSLNASFALRDNLIARVAYYHSLGRPDFDQYAGGLTLPDSESSTSTVITVNNAGIKAWSAKTVKVSLEYYFERIGLVSVSAFQRNFKNFFGQTVFDVTPEFLALYGLDPLVYGNYRVSTQYNINGTVRMEGVSFNYKQALTFLPAWARGVQVFVNGTAQRPTGEAVAEFNGYVPRTTNWGISLTREKYEVMMNWNHRSRDRNNEIIGRGIEPGTYNWGAERLYIDLTGEYYFWKKQFAVFAKLRNIRDVGTDTSIFGPNTPEHASLRTRERFGSLWTFGLKARF